MTSGTGTLTDDELRAERAMLDHARRCLEAMRRRAERLRPQGGDEIAAEALAWRLALRVASLADDGATGLFFGRLDYDGTGEAEAGRFYVGRRHIGDPQGEPVVIDWRAALARPFYRASPQHRLGVRLRRRFGYRAGTLTSIQDEPLTVLDEAASRTAADRVLVAEIERPRIGPMRDIVATIQPEQDDLIRAPVEETICIQGGPGTGKTAVGLHRAAFLLYEYRERLARDGVLVVGPSTAYLAFIHDVLPGLGEARVAQQSVEGLVDGVTVRGADGEAAAAVKADARMAEVVRRAAFLHVRPPAEPLAIRYGHRLLRLPAGQIRQRIGALVDEGIRYNVGRDHLRDWVVERCQRRLEASEALTGMDAPAAVSRRLGAARELRAFLDAAWPRLDPARLVYDLLTDADLLAAAADGILDEDEQARLGWARRPRGPRAARWSAGDAYLIDEAADVLGGIRSYGHVVADEAQDLSPMQLRAIGRRCRFGSATLLGDLAQGTTPWASARWEDALAHLARRRVQVQQLPRAFRAPREVLDFANRLLPEIAPGIHAAASVRGVPGSLEVREAGPAGLAASWLDALRRALAAEGSVGLICADAAVPAVRAELERHGLDYRPVERFELAARLALVPASAVKGLEFDQVVLVEPADIAGGPRGLHRLYTALTRAVLHLTVVHAAPLPEALAA